LKTSATSTDLGEILGVKSQTIEPENISMNTRKESDHLDLQKLMDEDSIGQCEDLNVVVCHILRNRKSELPDGHTKKRRKRLNSEQMGMLELYFQKSPSWSKSML